MRSGLLFTTTEGHFLTRFFLGKKKREEKKLVGVKEVTRTQANEAKGVNDPSRIPGLYPYNCVPPPRCNTVVRCESLSRDIRGKAT